jgi:predicted phosphodiesterase
MYQDSLEKKAMKRLRIIGMALILALVGLGGALTHAQDVVELVKLPYLQNVTQTSIVIMWETSDKVPSLLEYNNPAIPVSDSETTKIHEVPLSDLSPDTEYAYRVSIDGAGEQWTEWYTFRAAPLPDQPFRLAVYGDTRSQPDDHAAVIQAMMQADPAIVLHTGDLVNNGEIRSDWNKQFFGPAAPLLVDTPLFPSLGNHDQNARNYFNLFSLPNNEMWYAFTYGNTRIIALSTSTRFDPDGKQYAWLLEEFASPEYEAAQWHLVFFHYPPFSGEIGGDERVVRHLVPLFEEYAVDMVLNGHNHNYERSEKDGVIYIVTGGGGAPLYGFDEEEVLALNPYSVVHAKIHHFCTLDVSEQALVFTAWTVKGEVLDTLTLLAE